MLKGTSPTDGRRYPARPVLGVGALIFQQNHILLVERGREPLRGLWSLPGGGVETGERLQQAIVREVLEETGLTVEPLQLFEVFERILLDAEGRVEYHYVLMDYLCRPKQGELQAGDDVAKAAWFDLGTVRGLALTEGTLDVIERAFRVQDGG